MYLFCSQYHSGKFTLFLGGVKCWCLLPSWVLSGSTLSVKRVVCWYPCRFTVVRKLRDFYNAAIFCPFGAVVTKTQYISCLITYRALSRCNIAVNGWVFFIVVIDRYFRYLFSNFMVSLTFTEGERTFPINILGQMFSCRFFVWPQSELSNIALFCSQCFLNNFY